MSLTQAEMEAKYDAERNGTLYIKPEPGANLPADIKAWIDRHLAAEDTPLSDTEREIITAPYPSLATDIKPAPALTDDQKIVAWILDECERRGIPDDEEEGPDPRFDAAIDALAELPDALRLRAVVMIEEFLAAGSLDARFDSVVDELAALPEDRYAAGLSLVEGFLDGVAIAAHTAPLGG